MSSASIVHARMELQQSPCEQRERCTGRLAARSVLEVGSRGKTEAMNIVGSRTLGGVLATRRRASPTASS
jgi:hypothetical protein